LSNHGDYFKWKSKTDIVKCTTHSTIMAIPSNPKYAHIGIANFGLLMNMVNVVRTLPSTIVAIKHKMSSYEYKNLSYYMIQKWLKQGKNLPFAVEYVSTSTQRR
jgi:hypothetical protein